MQMDKFSDEVRSGRRPGRRDQRPDRARSSSEVQGLSERFQPVNEGMRNQSIGARADQRGDGADRVEACAADARGAGGVQQGDRPPAAARSRRSTRRSRRSRSEGGGRPCMLSTCLTFQVGRDRLARGRPPRPRGRAARPPAPVGRRPGWLAGVFVYRGRVVPVIDLHRLAGAGECPPHLSSRIILVPAPAAGRRRTPARPAGHAGRRHPRRSPDDGPRRHAPGDGRATDLGPVVADGRGSVRPARPGPAASRDASAARSWRLAAEAAA